MFAFDLLYLNGESLVTKSFEERRNMLKENFKAVEGEFQFAQCQDGNTVEEIQEALEESIKGRVVCFLVSLASASVLNGVQFFCFVFETTMLARYSMTT